jgi:hypothetical protein
VARNASLSMCPPSPARAPARPGKSIRSHRASRRPPVTGSGVAFHLGKARGAYPIARPLSRRGKVAPHALRQAVPVRLPATTHVSYHEAAVMSKGGSPLSPRPFTASSAPAEERK